MNYTVDNFLVDFEAYRYEFFMLDIETGGLSVCKNNITSIGCVNFKCEIDSPFKIFEAALINSVPNRDVNEKTVKFRQENNIDIYEETLPLYTPEEALRELYTFIYNNSTGKIPFIFCKHQNFDLAFMEAYYEEVLGNSTPWHYRNTADVATIVRICGKEPVEYMKQVEDNEAFKYFLSSNNIKGTKHSAVYDCMLQIAMMFSAMS